MNAALLFDLDGTLVDTDHLHIAAFNEVLAGHGIQLDRADYVKRVMGRANAAIAAELLPALPTAEAMRLLAEKEEAYRSLTRRLAEAAPQPGAGLTPIAGLISLLDWADARGIRSAVVTNAPRRNADLVLAALRLADRFATIVIADELPEMKPHPLPYLTALERLGAAASQSVVFEDSPSGIVAGSRAGLPVLGLMTTLSEAALVDAGATFAIADFHDSRIRPFVAGRQPAIA
ncbi:HAD superfamily hydrolase (TIGR01509 family) [Dongia mobilis]|uniref:HAD superfamily hydrolase (TIGR01509 family) n=1 Tax=Dongia mobilis TaxID=578943 RepID=A0A4R6WY10_9PROT|nr:HAD-IA family hydrolase [Dongia mobilis]TDQ84323.1 HAD superfamily hydrolase (TIGR01509 family) [Dongia mobilis]